MSKQSKSDLQAGTSITFLRGCLTYEGTIVSRETIADGSIVTYEVDVNGCGGGAFVDRVSIHDGQVLRVYA